MAKSLEEIDEEVDGKFANCILTTTFDLVVAADEISLKVRGLAFVNGYFQTRSLNSYASYFFIPFGDTDTIWLSTRWVKGDWYIVLRPDNVGHTRAFPGLTA